MTSTHEREPNVADPSSNKNKEENRNNNDDEEGEKPPNLGGWKKANKEFGRGHRCAFAIEIVGALLNGAIFPVFAIAFQLKHSKKCTNVYCFSFFFNIFFVFFFLYKIFFYFCFLG